MATTDDRGSIQTPVTTCKACVKLDRAEGPRFKEINAKGCPACSSIRQAIIGYYRQQSLFNEAKISEIFLFDRDASSISQSIALYTNDGLGIPHLEFCSTEHAQRGHIRLGPTGPKIRVHPSISGNTGSKEAILWAKSCVDICRKSHSRCQRKRDITLPTRVLDLAEFDDRHPEGGKIKVFESKNNKAPYICLSYCWGRHQPVTLRQSNLARFTQEGIPWPELPKTLREAIHFAHLLGFRYLWVDALCIIQDSKADKGAELRRMCRIYEGSDFTLSITKSKNTRDGCYAKAAKEYVGFEITGSRISINFQGISVRRQLPHFDHWKIPLPFEFHLLEDFPLLSRAWAFQEMILSSKILHFGPHELLWECREHRACECGNFYFERATMPKAEELPHLVSQADKKAHLRSWMELLTNYTSRQLTFGSDRHDALLGVAERFQSPFLGKFVAGIWTSHLHHLILWSVKTPGPRPKTTWPSWSWLSACFSEGQAIYHRLESLVLEEYIKVCGLRIRYSRKKSPARRMSTQPYFLEFTGKLIRASWEENMYYEYRPAVGMEINIPWTGMLASPISVHRDFYDASRPSFGRVTIYCAAVAVDGRDNHFLVLRCLDLANKVYERVGRCEIGDTSFLQRLHSGEIFENQKIVII